MAYRVFGWVLFTLYVLSMVGNMFCELPGLSAEERNAMRPVRAVLHAAVAWWVWVALHS